MKMKGAIPRQPIMADDVFTSPIKSHDQPIPSFSHPDSESRAGSSSSKSQSARRGVDSSIFEPTSEADSTTVQERLALDISQLSLKTPASPVRRPHANTIASPARPLGRPSAAALLSYGQPLRVGGIGGMDRSLSSGSEAMLRTYSMPVSTLRDLGTQESGTCAPFPVFGMQRELNIPSFVGQNTSRFVVRKPSTQIWKPSTIEEEISREPGHFDTSDIEGTDTEINHLEAESAFGSFDPDQTPRATPTQEHGMDSNPFFTRASDSAISLDRETDTVRSHAQALSRNAPEDWGTPDLVSDLHRSSCLSSHGGHSRESSWSSDVSTMSGPTSPQKGLYLSNAALLPHRQEASPARLSRARPQLNRAITTYT